MWYERSLHFATCITVFIGCHWVFDSHLHLHLYCLFQTFFNSQCASPISTSALLGTVILLLALSLSSVFFVSASPHLHADVSPSRGLPNPPNRIPLSTTTKRKLLRNSLLGLLDRARNLRLCRLGYRLGLAFDFGCLCADLGPAILAASIPVIIPPISLR